MAVKIRLRRMGAKKRPFYRIVVADSRTARDGRFIEAIGYYDPNTDPPTMKLDTEKAQMWLSRGAQPTDIAIALLRRGGLLGGVRTPAPAVEEEKPAKKTSRKAAAKKEEAAPAEAAAKLRQRLLPLKPLQNRQQKPHPQPRKPQKRLLRNPSKGVESS